jgi:nicotinamide-nucleotide amidase
LENKWGTAPGFYGKIKNCLVFTLPGPPRELQPMFENCVMPVLSTLYPLAHAKQELIASAFLIPESELEAGFLKCKMEGISWQTRLETDRIVFTIKSDADEENIDTKNKIETFYNKVVNTFQTGLIRKKNKVRLHLI